MNTNRRGVVLLLVLVVVAMLALASMTFCELMLNERRAAETAGRQARARALAQSGVELARLVSRQDAQDQLDEGGVYDNPQRFANVLVADDPTPAGTRLLHARRPQVRKQRHHRRPLRPARRVDADQREYAAANEERSDGKDKAKDVLMALPSMTDEIADAILDWLDPDDTPRDNGAEAEYYGSLRRLTPRGTVRSSRSKSCLLVRGVTPQLLFGLDAAPMGLIEASPDESPRRASTTPTARWTTAGPPTSPSTAPNRPSNPTAPPKINLNGNDLQKLYNDLKDALDENSAKFIVLVSGRAASQRPTAQTASPRAGAVSVSNIGEPVDVSKLKASVQLKSVLDLIGATADCMQGDNRDCKGATQGRRRPPSPLRPPLPNARCPPICRS